jgi:dihydroxyacid dehydratase/phosphogluconate dehydratase
VQRAPYLAVIQGSVRRTGAIARPSSIEPDDGIEARIIFFDTREEVLQRIDGADLALADEPRNLGGRLEMQIHV